MICYDGIMNRKANQPLLKPLTFAHPFEVNISPAIQGAWSRSDDGWWLWQQTFILRVLFTQSAV